MSFQFRIYILLTNDYNSPFSLNIPLKGEETLEVVHEASQKPIITNVTSNGAAEMS